MAMHFVLLSLLQVLSLTDGFTFSCPVQSHWKLRATSLCRRYENYTCLLDVLTNQYRENCKGPKIVGHGYKYVFRPNFDRLECISERYQPPIFCTTGYSDCLLSKSKCNDEGQTTFTNGFRTSDRTCKCDVRTGHMFVLNSIHRCYCIPSEEDCSCYRRSLSNDSFNSTEKTLKGYQKCNNDDGIIITSFTKDNTSNRQTDVKNKRYDGYKYNVVNPNSGGNHKMAAVFVSVVLLLLLTFCFPISVVLNNVIISHGMKKLKDRHEKKDTLMVHDEVIPKHILEQFEKRLEQWKKDDQQFVSTEAEKHVIQKVLTQSSVTLVGNSGTGKSFLSKHIALIMMKHGYTVIPCSKPKDIGKWFKHGRKTLFVFDDVCGRYTLNQQIYTDWKQRLDHIISLLEDKCCKIISTCRLEVYKDEVFSNLSIFKMCNIDLSSQEFKFSAAEKNALAEVYFKENTDEVKEWSDKYDFFPLLCSLYHKQNLQKNVSISSFFSNPFEVFKDQVVQMYGESDAGKMKYCSLVLCVMFNNTLTEENLSPKDKKIGAVIEDLLEECELNKGTSIKGLKKSLETLVGTYVVKEDNTYKIIHDKLFDFLAKYFGEKMLQIFIDHANTGFIRERFLWKITDNMGTEIEFVIRIPDKYINRYIERLLKDWENGYVNNVCGNRNMKSTTFTENFITRLNQLDLSKQQELVFTKDIYNEDIALAGSCYIGTIELVKWLISRNSDINYCRKDGCFPLLWASQEGHVDVVKVLLQHSADVNKCDNNGVSPLYIASHNGHVGVVKVLLLHSADVNKCNNNGVSPLSIASHNGHVGVVKVLLLHSADVNKCNNNGASPLYIASQNGHVGVVKVLLLHSADVNKCMNDGVSPLYIASQNGHVNVVKELLQHSADVNKCSNDGTPPLQIACYNNRIEVVHVLLQCDDVDIDLCDDDGCSSLYWASQKGNVDVVKVLLQHSADVNKCDFKGKNPLNIAQEQGHIEIESLLKGKGINQH